MKYWQWATLVAASIMSPWYVPDQPGRAMLLLSCMLLFGGVIEIVKVRRYASRGDRT